jgi:hypothetical protein
MKKLSPELREQLLNEMRLAALLNEKSWSRRYGLSPRQLRRLRAQALERPLARSGDAHRILILGPWSA